MSNIAYYDSNEDLQQGESLSTFVRTNTEQSITGEKTFNNVNVNDFLKIITGYLQATTPNGKFLSFSDTYNGLYFTCDIVLATDSNDNDSTKKISIKFPTISENYTLKLPSTAPSTGQYLSVDSNDSTQLIWNTPSGSGDVSASSNFNTDNVIIKSDGTAKGVQSTGLSVDDSNNLSGVVNLTQTGYTDLSEITTPSNPSANIGRLYTKDDSGTTKLYFKDSAGVETDLTTSSSGISNLIEDTTPQLGGNLDLNGNVITGLEIGTNVQAHSAILDNTTASFTSALETKLSGIESNATADQTGAEIKTALFAEIDTNNLTDALLSKLNGIESGADVTDTANVTSAGALMDSELTDLVGIKALDTSTIQSKPIEGAFVNGDKTKLDGIETGADVTDTANVTSAGALMDSELTDLAGIKALDTSTIQSKPIEGAFVDGDKTKLDGIETGADVTDETNVVSSLNGATLTSVAGTLTDKVLMQDVSDSDNLKQDTVGDLLKLKPEALSYALSDETTDLTTGTAKLTVRMPYAFTLTDVRASVTTAPVGSTITVDINEGGVSILSTKLTIDASEKTSTTAATPVVISDSSLADDAEITFDIDQVGSSTAGAGLKVTLIGYQS